MDSSKLRDNLAEVLDTSTIGGYINTIKTSNCCESAKRKIQNREWHENNPYTLSFLFVLIHRDIGKEDQNTSLKANLEHIKIFMYLLCLM